MIAYGELGILGQLAAKPVEAVYSSERAKLIYMLKMVERHVVVFLQNNKIVIRGRVLLVSLLF